MHHHTGPARVFNSEDWLNGMHHHNHIEPGDVDFIRCEGARLWRTGSTDGNQMPSCMTNALDGKVALIYRRSGFSGRPAGYVSDTSRQSR